MTFLWPGLLALLVILPLLIGAYIWILRRRKVPAIRYSSLSLISVAQPRTSRIRRHLPFALFVVALGSLTVALGRPAAVLAVPTNQTSIILAIDVSGSMCSTDVDPTRLQAAEAAAADFIKRQSATTQIGLVAFSSFAEEVQAPTTDTSALLAALQTLQTGRRTAIGSGILAAIDAISEIDPNVAPSVNEFSPGVEPTPVAPGDYAPDIIVLLTDGANNTGPDPADAAKQAADRGIRVYTIGFGTEAGGPLSPECGSQFQGREPGGGGAFGGGGFGGGGGGGGTGFRRGIDDQALMQVAQATGGTYHPASSADELESVFASLPTSLITKHEVFELSVAFAALGAALAVAAIGLSQAWRPLP